MQEIITQLHSMLQKQKTNKNAIGHKTDMHYEKHLFEHVLQHMLKKILGKTSIMGF